MIFNKKFIILENTRSKINETKPKNWQIKTLILKLKAYMAVYLIEIFK